MAWRYTLDLNKTIREVEDLELPEQRRRLTESLKTEAEKLPNDHGHWLNEAIKDYAECIGLCEDIEEVDAILEDLYDFADAELIWLGL